MKSILVILISTLLHTGLNSVSSTKDYIYCGYHGENFSMTAYHFNSEFWVDMIVDEAKKWNKVHNCLTINRTRSSTIPLGKDGNNVIGWISESDLDQSYNLSWAGTVGWTISWLSNNCGEMEEADVFFNPNISLFSPQITVPYNLGYQEIALHELGHVMTQNHEDRTLAVMTSGQAVSNVLYASDKVGWFQSSKFDSNPTDKKDRIST